MSTKIEDQNGRLGRVIEDRGSVLFAVPDGHPDKVDGVAPGGCKGTYITSTAWHVQPDGSYQGLWYDSPTDEILSANRVAE